ncbi:MAG: Holliday junction branch migration DNA helicase RuvB [Synechococcus sp. SB0673_bin_10]|nr:Holliday junction branch migration DNA helicase RuvB [Synechococcus sp. SB0667_bin_8]MYF36906.1 Holliday junction branch migration DNA helicase RuvB [Synechococcus sp. SB0678_bin_12]MYG64933.1 Holliday junction branch migration DNA helicase RuvB [Synechococcus sp. SB0675_bin_7]MYI71254.1 Holliday junction branch migration DNA helicase RuvB [Synechococcus sp. SB0673_bin_10]MYI88270.1 Holliday junction branch migration DNA helicase RuvB [Synechococcus sp. SB0672_bin_10]MYK85499.1 Holliday jun
MAIVPSNSSGRTSPASPRNHGAAPRPAKSPHGPQRRAEATAEEQGHADEALRPQRLGDYIGQSALKQVLHIALEAARHRQEPLDHLLLYGPPGLGKTTMAMVLAAELTARCRITSAPALERPRDIIGLLMTLEQGDVLFIDEIHRLPRMAEEILYPAMEDFRLDLSVGKGTTARSRSIGLPRFTLVGATTKAGSISSPLRDRFGMVHRLEFYAAAELQQIVERSAQLLQMGVERSGARAIASRCRGTPRIANRLLRRVRDYALVKTCPAIDDQVVADALTLHRIDPLGLDPSDHRLLLAIAQQFEGGPVGLATLAAVLGEDADTIETVLEPYLLQIGFLQRTPRGRRLAPPAYRHLGLPSTPTTSDPVFPGQLPLPQPQDP